MGQELEEAVALERSEPVSAAVSHALQGELSQTEGNAKRTSEPVIVLPEVQEGRLLERGAASEVQDGSLLESGAASEVQEGRLLERDAASEVQEGGSLEPSAAPEARGTAGEYVLCCLSFHLVLLCLAQRFLWALRLQRRSLHRACSANECLCSLWGRQVAYTTRPISQILMHRLPNKVPIRSTIITVLRCLAASV